MARTAEQILKEHLGKMVLQAVQMQAENEQLTERLSEALAQIPKPEPTERADGQ